MQKIYGLYGWKHHVVEMRGDVTDAGRQTNEQLKIELLRQWKLEAESRNNLTMEYSDYLIISYWLSSSGIFNVFPETSTASDNPSPRR